MLALARVEASHAWRGPVAGGDLIAKGGAPSTGGYYPPARARNVSHSDFREISLRRLRFPFPMYRQETGNERISRGNDSSAVVH